MCWAILTSLVPCDSKELSSKPVEMYVVTVKLRKRLQPIAQPLIHVLYKGVLFLPFCGSKEAKLSALENKDLPVIGLKTSVKYLSET